MTYYDTLGVRKNASEQDIKVFIVKNLLFIFILFRELTGDSRLSFTRIRIKDP